VVDVVVVDVTVDYFLLDLMLDGLDGFVGHSCEEMR
jgi:DNA-binding response OmpR family regulator